MVCPMRHLRELGKIILRKFTLLLAVVALAGAPSLASAKSMKHHHAKMHTHHAKVAKMEKKQADPNENTYKLFANMFAPSKHK